MPTRRISIEIFVRLDHHFEIVGLHSHYVGRIIVCLQCTRRRQIRQMMNRPPPQSGICLIHAVASDENPPPFWRIFLLAHSRQSRTGRYARHPFFLETRYAHPFARAVSEDRSPAAFAGQGGGSAGCPSFWTTATIPLVAVGHEAIAEE